MSKQGPKESCQVYLFNTWQDCMFEIEKSGKIILSFKDETKKSKKEAKIDFEKYSIHRLSSDKYPQELKNKIINCDSNHTLIIESGIGDFFTVMFKERATVKKIAAANDVHV